MMRIFITLSLLLLAPLSSTQLLIFEEPPTLEQQSQLFDLILQGEPPRVFYETSPIDLESRCLEVASSLKLEWIPPTLWQLGVLHSFFLDREIRNGILACKSEGWDPLAFDEMLHFHLAKASKLDEVANYFDRESKTLPNIVELFFQANHAIASLYQRASGSDEEFLRIVLSELPPFEEWKKQQFPFWDSPWIYNLNSVQIFYEALQDVSLLSEILSIERAAYENGEWVLYRGYPGSGYPSSLEIDHAHNHALSFGSTLLGGAFFSLEACSLAYSGSDSFLPHSFLALRVTPHEMKKVFRVGPLHPFIQMLVDGEMFHAHTKISTKLPDVIHNKPLSGYFMKCNKYCNDPLGYILSFEMSPEDLEAIFLSLCEKSGVVFPRQMENNLLRHPEEGI